MRSSFQHLLTMFRKMRAENWGGLISLTGTLILGFGGDMQSVGAMLFALLAEAIFVRYGDKTAGYSTACALITCCGLFMLSSVATEGNASLQLFIIASSSVWFLGALRYPIERMGFALSSAKPYLSARLLKTASVIQPLVGALSLVLRVPVLISSAIGGNVVIFLSVVLYGAADILLGRIHTLKFWRTEKKPG